jgi:hypothetical protein
MAKIVCIAAGTVRPGICEVGDVVGIHDDKVVLTGNGNLVCTYWSINSNTTNYCIFMVV